MEDQLKNPHKESYETTIQEIKQLLIKHSLRHRPDIHGEIDEEVE